MWPLILLIVLLWTVLRVRGTFRLLNSMREEQ